MSMKATNIYDVPGITGYVVRVEDGSYHATSKAMRILRSPISATYMRQRLDAGAVKELTGSAEGRALLASANGYNGSMEVDRARAAASARWGDRGESVRIRVDSDVAAGLSQVPQNDRRRFASDAIRAALAQAFGSKVRSVR